MNKAEFCAAIAEKTNATKKASTIAVDSIIEVISETLAAGEKIQIIGFGSFESKERKARQGRNPRKPDEIIEIAAAVAPVFKPGKSLKDKVNK